MCAGKKELAKRSVRTVPDEQQLTGGHDTHFVHRAYRATATADRKGVRHGLRASV